MARLYTYLTATLSVRPQKSLPQLVSLVETSQPSIELVDFDEETRRVVIRAKASEAPFVEKLIRDYAASASVEVKASFRARIDVKKLRSVGARCIVHGNRILFYTQCRNGAIFGEVKGREVLLKYCRWASSVDPAALPPALCSFSQLERLVDLVSTARQCFIELLQALELAQEGSG